MQYKKIVLPNGLRTIITNQPGTEAVTVMIFARVGSRRESKKISGIAHFVEHLAFKGTKNFPTTLHISKALDSVGSEYNAFTSKDYTGYYVKVDKQHIELAMQILSDMTFYPLYDETEFQREKGVIIEEINMYEDTPMYMTEEYFEEQLYGKDNALGRFVIGNKNSITKMTRQDVIAFHNKYYQSSNLTVSIAGSVPVDVERLLKKYFLKNKKKSIPATKQFSQLPAKEIVCIKPKKTEQMHLSFGLPVDLNYGHKNVLTAKIVNIVFGGNMSSRLFINIRERQGLCYYINSNFNLYEDVANWQVVAGVDPKRLDKAINLINKEWQKLVKGISKAEFEQAREYYKGKLALQMEDSSQVAQWYAKQELFSLKIQSPEDIKQQVDKLTQVDVNKWLAKQVKLNQLRLTVVGAAANKNHFLKLLS